MLIYLDIVLDIKYINELRFCYCCHKCKIMKIKWLYILKYQKCCASTLPLYVTPEFNSTTTGLPITCFKKSDGFLFTVPAVPVMADVDDEEDDESIMINW